MARNKINIGLALLPLLILFAGPAKAVEATFHGTLTGNPPCNIDSVDVVFEDMGISLIDGERYSTPFELKIDCADSLDNAIPVYIGYEGMSSPFNSDALQTTRAGLGIILYYNGRIVPPNNEDIPITISGGSSYTLDLNAIPVKNYGSPPTEGVFYATGRVEIRYP